MNRIRRLVRTVAASIAATALLALGGVATAWAKPAPVEPDRAATTGRGIVASSTSSGIDLWQVVSLTAATAVLAVVLTIVVSHLVTGHRRREGRPAPT